MTKPAGRVSIILFVLAVCLLTRPGVRGQETGTLRLHFMDVGHGDGAVLISPRGEVVLFDGGTPADCGKALGYLQSLGLTQIDYHVATSYQPDHIGCAADALKMLPLTRVAFDHGGAAETREFARYAAAAADKRRAARPGQRITLDGDSGQPVTIELLRVGTKGLAGDDEPAAGLVAVIRYREFSAEIGGDLSGAVERAIAERVGHVDVYGVHNHASPDSTTADWLSIVQPQVGIVSVSPGNPDRAPSTEAMERLHAAGVTTYWTSIGNGAWPEPGRDSVVGNIVIEVPADAARFSVRGDGMAAPSAFATGRDAAARNARTLVAGRAALASATAAATGVQELTISTFAGGTGTYGYADGSRALFRLPSA
jgi:competence protein ComEC